MKIGVTGGNGFIGRLLVKKHIEMGDQVVVLSRNKDRNIEGVTVSVGDLSIKDSLVEFVKDLDVLYHCAAEITDESKMEATNVMGTKNLIEMASGKINHWVQLSSAGVYGPIGSGVITEKQKYNPINEYEKSKLKSDLLVLDATVQNFFTSTIIRPSIVFGVNMKNKSLFELIKTIDNGFYFFVGKRDSSANYVTVENVVESLYLGATNSKAINKIYNISDWSTIEKFVGIITNHLQKPLPKYRIPLKVLIFIAKTTSFIPNNPLTVSRLMALCNRSEYSTNKIEKELDYKPKNTQNDGLKELVREYISRNKNK
jgi:nucleoside-diphosphate-sugar epimerase